jgi:hypothetical protein
MAVLRLNAIIHNGQWPFCATWVIAARCSLLFVGIPQSIACRAAKENDSEGEHGRGHRIDCDGLLLATANPKPRSMYVQKLETICSASLQACC